MNSETYKWQWIPGKAYISKTSWLSLEALKQTPVLCGNIDKEKLFLWS